MGELIWDGEAYGARVELWRQDSPSADNLDRWAIWAMRGHRDASGEWIADVGIKHLYQLYAPVCDPCTYVLGRVDGKPIENPRVVCRRGTAHVSHGRASPWPHSRDRCPEADSDTRRGIDHRQTHCHGERGALHQEHAEQLARAVLESYKRAPAPKPKAAFPPRPGALALDKHLAQYAPPQWSAEDIAEFRRQLAIARAEKAGA